MIPESKQKWSSSHFVNKAGSFLVQEKGGERDDNDKKEAKNVVASAAAAVADT